jgi:DNA (cytosine-5)-methyltransferase 1
MSDGLNCVDLFSGAGGFSLGFKQAGFTISAAVDRSEAALQTYSHNLPDANVIQADLQEVSSSQLFNRVDVSANEIDVLIGGPPCKGFSTAGKMNPDDPKNSLVANYVNILSKTSPRVVVMENVTGMLSMQDGEYVNQLINIFRREGYEISDKPVVLNAAHYGVPQHRNRVFFFASKRGTITPPTPTHYNPSLPDEKRPNAAEEPWVPLVDAVEDLAFLKYGEEALEHKLQPLSQYQAKMRAESGDELYNHLATNHTEDVRKRFKQLKPGQSGNDLPEEHQTKKHSLQRWHYGQPAPTATTLPDDFIHYSQPRIPTVRELARIQSFPDWFKFKGPRTTGGRRRENHVPQYSQVGNAVPPRLAKHVAESVKNHLRYPVRV